MVIVRGANTSLCKLAIRRSYYDNGTMRIKDKGEYGNVYQVLRKTFTS